MIGSVIVFFLIFGATMAYVGWPLVHPLLAEDEPSVRERRRQDLLDEKERLLASLRDLEHERRTGKLDEADHALLSERLKVKAAEVLKDLDALGAAPAPAPTPARAAPASVTPLMDIPLPKDGTPTIRVTHVDLKSEVSKAASAAAAEKFCTKCGRQAKNLDDKFCGRCGATLPAD